MAKPKFILSKRMVVSRFWSNADLADLERNSGIRNLRLTMIGLWAVADEAGIFEWEPRTMAGLLYPYNSDDQQTLGPAMDKFVEAGFLKKIEVDGHWYGVWPNWGEHNDFAHKGQTRYPEAYTVHYGVSPTKTVGRGKQLDTAPAVEVPPSPTESRLEVKKLEVEVLPSTQTTIHEIPSGEQEEKDQNPSATRLAKLLFKLLDQPRDQIQNAGVWESQVVSLLKTYPEEEIAAVMEHGIKTDTFSAEYLTIAREPMKSFVKTYDNIRKGWKALQRGAAAAANRAAKLKPEGKTAPGALGNTSRLDF